MSVATNDKFKMSISLNVLNHLGINLYSNIPSVLAEAVANAWDADAEKVFVNINLTDEKISIRDTGHGMSLEDLNDKFLNVGYQRRENGEANTPKHNRPVMGRKGIGKLSLFSIADTIEVHSVKEGDRNGLIMSLTDIRQSIKDGQASYTPKEISSASIDINEGTVLILRDFRKKIYHTEKALRKRLARRFSIIGSENKFEIQVNGEAIEITDRDYYHKIQCAFKYGDVGKECSPHFKNAIHNEDRDTQIFSGWIGTVEEVGQLMDDGESLNKIVVMIRGKLAQEDILQSFGEGGVYSNYLIGEIHADFLDDNEQDDIATSSRQSIVEDDERFVKLKKAVQTELNHIQNTWAKIRNDAGTKAAMQMPVVEKWFNELSKDDKNKAKNLFGKIHQITTNDPAQRNIFIKHGILAFESMKAKQNLDALEVMSADNIVAFGEIFNQVDDLESSFYYQIVAGRINVVKALQKKIDDDALERVIQEHLFDHLWLLDPSWERATGTERMEKRLTKEFSDINTKLDEDEQKGRLDIKYRKTGGQHVIIELKRASVVTDSYTLGKQVGKYHSALSKILADQGRSNEPIEIICIVGRDLLDWNNPKGREKSNDMLKVNNARVVKYDELIENSFNAYQEYLSSKEKAGRIFDLLRQIETDIDA